MTYTDLTTNNVYPKTLFVRNQPGEMIWQVYHVQKESEAVKLAQNATNNGFYGISLEDYDSYHEETWPDWRETCSPEILE